MKFPSHSCCSRHSCSSEALHCLFLRSLVTPPTKAGSDLPFTRGVPKVWQQLNVGTNVGWRNLKIKILDTRRKILKGSIDWKTEGS